MRKKHKEVLSQVSMKFEEKMKKNKNCEISHIVRPEVTPEVYKQKQNTLFIFECMEHRRLKETWARLWVYSDECTAECIRVYAWHGWDRCAARRFVTIAQTGVHG